MSQNVSWLDRFAAAGLTVDCVAHVAAQHPVAGHSTWHQHATLGLIRVDWPAAPTPEQQAAADAIVAGYDPAAVARAALISANWANATAHCDAVADARAMLKLEKIRAAHPAPHAAGEMVDAIEGWMESVWARYYVLKAQIIAGTKTVAAVSDYADLPAPHTFSDVLSATL